MKCIIAAAAILLGGCAGPGQWAKPDATEAQLRADLTVCRDLAGDATARDQRIGLDIVAARGDGRVNISEPLRDDIRGYNTTRHYRDVVDTCMRARGYRLDGDAS